ncbi:hypothetical protein BGZ46_005397 [Entomortierella lignicola]|nr:hypothetical protein BGZ46_005397 [Entomortierella lignicola]
MSKKTVFKAKEEMYTSYQEQDWSQCKRRFRFDIQDPRVPQRQFLVLGDSGSVDKPEQDLIGKQLHELGFSQRQTDEPKAHQEFVVILSTTNIALRPVAKTVRKLQDRRGWVTSIAYSPRGLQIASGSYDMTVGLWDVTTGDCLHSLHGHIDWATSVIYSPNGDQVASAAQDGAVRLWDATAGDFVHTFHSHIDEIIGVAYSPNGDRIASGSLDNTV